jgi:ATP-dependent DNA ligase
MQTWKFPSSRGDKEHTTTLGDDGLLSCSCPGYYIRKEGKPYFCRHTRDEVAKKLGLTLVIKGDYEYGIKPDGVQMDLIPQQDNAEVYRSAKERGYIRPMLATAPEKNKSIDDYPPEDYFREEKWDGERKVVSGHKGVVYTWNRPREGKGEIGKEEPLPPQIQQGFELLAKQCDFVIDGELWLKGGKSTDVNRLENRPKLQFVVFDILRLNGAELVNSELELRRKIMEKFFAQLQWPATPWIFVSPLIENTQEALDAIWARKNGEGIMVKHRKSLYEEGRRSAKWIKVKRKFQERFQIYGYEAGKNGPHSKVLARNEKGETSVKTKNNVWLKKLNAEPDKYLGKWLVIEHQGWNDTGGVRHPMWQYLEEEVTK